MTAGGGSAVACLLAIIAVGCGATHKSSTTQPSDRARVETVLHSYLRAQSQGDGTAACALLTPAAQKQLIGLVVKAGKGLVPGTASCSDAVALVRAVAGTQLLSALQNARVAQIRVSGATATARVLDGAAFKPQQVRFEEAGGSWKIAAVPTLGGG